MAPLCKMTVPYPGYTRIVEDAILIMLWRQNEGGTGKNFSRQDAPLHYLPAGITPCIPPLPS
jgi:hypothetical protein